MRVRRTLGPSSFAHAANRSPPFPFPCHSLAADGASTQAANALVVSSAALAVRESELGAIVMALDAEEADTLLKYVYKALSVPSDKSSVWLRWHAALVEKAGTGAIVRVITEVGHTA